MDEWLLVELAPVGSAGFTRDGDILRSLFDKFPVDSGWTLLCPPLEILEHRHLDFSVLLDSANHDLHSIPLAKLREFARVRGFPAIHRRILWLRLIPETWKFQTLTSSVQPEISTQIEKDVLRTIPERTIADFTCRLRRGLLRYASRKYDISWKYILSAQQWATAKE
jgi:hypothetical protein